MPKLVSCFDRRDLNVCPPRDFVAVAMKLSMMVSTQWHSEFVADLASERSWLREFEMMRERWQTRQGCAATNARWALFRCRTGLRNGETVSVVDGC